MRIWNSLLALPRRKMTVGVSGVQADELGLSIEEAITIMSSLIVALRFLDRYAQRGVDL